MAKVRSTMTLSRVKDGWSLKIPDPNNLKAQCVDKFIRSDEVQSIILEVEIRAPYVEKTLSQLGYLHAAVWPVFYQYYRDQGVWVESKEQMDHVIAEVKYAIGFTEVHNLQFSSEDFPAPKSLYFPKSFAYASKIETSEAIDQIIRLAADFGMIIPDPSEYLERHGATEFEN